MLSFRDWLARVLLHGESVQETPPVLADEERPSVLELLRDAFDRLALDVAGPPIPFDPRSALAAASALARGCWLLVAADQGEPATLPLDAEPSSPSAHLSADITLRFLVDVRRRAVLRDAAGALTVELDRLLRAWPLSGVLADLDGEPTTPPEFGGHAGLQLLYAERLVRTGRPGWVPQSGPAREWVERIYAERGKPVPVKRPEEDIRG